MNRSARAPHAANLADGQRDTLQGCSFSSCKMEEVYHTSFSVESEACRVVITGIELAVNQCKQGPN